MAPPALNISASQRTLHELSHFSAARRVSSRVGGSQLSGGSAYRTASTSPENSPSGGPHDAARLSSQTIGPGSPDFPVSVVPSAPFTEE